MQLSIIVPVYKEEGNIPEFLRRILNAGVLTTVYDHRTCFRSLAF